MEKQDPLIHEIDHLRNRLTDALEALEAIRSGDVDAVVVYGESGEQIYTLQGADQTYRTMVEEINEGAAILSENGVITWANDCLAEMLKIPLETLLSSQINASIVPVDLKAFEAVLLLSLQEKCKIELDLQDRNGSLIPVLLSLSPIPSSGGAAICLVATDLSEHKQNIEIATAERIAKAIIEQASEAIVVCDVNGKIVRASQAAQRLAAENPMFITFEQAYPLVFELISQGDNPFSIQTVLSGTTFRGIDATLHDPRTNTTKSLQLSAKPLNIPGDGNLGCVITMTDVSERKQAEQAIRKYAKQLERSNKDLEDFAFIASHDLQEPLRKIQSFGMVLVNQYSSQMDDKAGDMIARMQQAANRMEKMINDLLDYSRVSTKARDFELVDLNQVVKNVLSDLNARVVAAGGRVESTELPVIEADPVQMYQLLQNLIGNALKFHAQGSPPHVKVYAIVACNGGKVSTSEEVEIYVEDKGIGFDLKYQERIFQPFQRLHGRSEFEGSGIGLSICRRIVERHNGNIRVNSMPGNGSTFIVTLPKKHKLTM